MSSHAACLDLDHTDHKTGYDIIFFNHHFYLLQHPWRVTKWHKWFSVLANQSCLRRDEGRSILRLVNGVKKQRKTLDDPETIQFPKHSLTTKHNSSICFFSFLKLFLTSAKSWKANLGRFLFENIPVFAQNQHFQELSTRIWFWFETGKNESGVQSMVTFYRESLSLAKVCVL